MGEVEMTGGSPLEFVYHILLTEFFGIRHDIFTAATAIILGFHCSHKSSIQGPILPLILSTSEIISDLAIAYNWTAFHSPLDLGTPFSSINFQLLGYISTDFYAHLTVV